MITLTYAVHFVALLLAGLLAMRERSPRQRSIARAIALLFAMAIVRRVCLPDDIAARGAAWGAGVAPPPYEGAQRLAWAVGQMVSRAWYFVVARGVWKALRREQPGEQSPPTEPGEGENGERERDRFPRHPWIMLTAGSVASVALYFAAYPLIRGPIAIGIAVVGYVLALIAQLAIGTAASLRGHWPTREDRAAWLTAWILICSSLAGLAGPWALAHPRRDWYVAPWIATATWIVIGGVHAWILLSRRTESPSA